MDSKQQMSIQVEFGSGAQNRRGAGGAGRPRSHHSRSTLPLLIHCWLAVTQPGNARVIPGRLKGTLPPSKVATRPKHNVWHVPSHTNKMGSVRSAAHPRDPEMMAISKYSLRRGVGATWRALPEECFWCKLASASKGLLICYKLGTNEGQSDWSNCKLCLTWSLEPQRAHAYRVPTYWQSPAKGNSDRNGFLIEPDQVNISRREIRALYFTRISA